LLAGKDKTLLIRWDSFLVLNLGLDVLNGVAGLNLESDGFAGESFNENLDRQVSNCVNNKIIL
jgi:hypothetical protein